MDYAAKLLTVAMASIAELWVSIPMGFLFKLVPIDIVLATGLGASIGVAAVLLVGAPLRDRVMSRFFRQSSSYARSASIMNRYGAIGLGLLAPIIFGAPLTAILGIALGADARRLALWSIAGVWLWTLGLVILGTYAPKILLSFIAL